MSLVALRDSIISSIDAEIATFKAVLPHGGKFDKEELKRIALQSPAALVAVMAGPVEREGGEAMCDAIFTVFVITKGSSQTQRETAVIALAQEVGKLAVHDSWAYEHARAPTGVRLDNLYAGEIDRMGVALWAVSWSQYTAIAPFDFDSLDWLHTVHADYDFAPKDGVVDSEQIIQVGGDFMSAYGHLNVSTAIATAIAAPDTYQKAAGTTALKLASDVDMPVDGRLRHTGTVLKPFLATASGSVVVDTDERVTLAFAVNGTVDEDTAVELDLTVAEGAEAFSLKSVVNLDENDYVELWVKAASAIGVTITKSNLVLAAT